MRAVGGEHMTDRQAATADEAVTSEVVQVPFIDTQRAVEPHRLIEACRDHGAAVGVATS